MSIAHLSTATPSASATLTDAVSDLMVSLGSGSRPAQSVQELTSSLIHALADTLPGDAVTSVTRSAPRDDAFGTFAVSDPAASGFDELQREAGVGPSLDAIVSVQPVTTADVTSDRRWDRLHGVAHHGSAPRSVVSAQIVAPSFRGSLTAYSRLPGVFSEQDCVAVTSAAAVVGLGLSADRHRDQVDALERALETSRTIGVAVGILMVQHRVTRERAFQALVETSQQTQCKLRDLADDIVLTGAAPSTSNRTSAQGAPARGAKRRD